MSAEQFIAIASVLLALVFEYVPKAEGWYQNLDSQRKQLVMLGFIGVAVAGSFGLSCGGYIGAVACEGGWDEILFEAVKLFGLAAAANQGTHLLTKRQDLTQQRLGAWVNQQQEPGD